MAQVVFDNLRPLPFELLFSVVEIMYGNFLDLLLLCMFMHDVCQCAYCGMSVEGRRQLAGMSSLCFGIEFRIDRLLWQMPLQTEPCC